MDQPVTDAIAAATAQLSTRDKLRQKLRAAQMNRKTAVQQRTFLEKKNIPSDLLDERERAQKSGKGMSPEIMQKLLQQVQGMTNKTKMKAPSATVDAADAAFSEPVEDEESPTLEELEASLE